MADRKTLLVEGSDDEHVLKHICGNRGIPRLDEIKAHGGAPELLESIPTRLRFAEEGDVVGVIIDANASIESRWRAIRDRFVTAGYQNVPDDPDPDGTILEPPADSMLPRAGVWIMPDNETCGTLEKFLKFLIPQPDVLFDHVIASIDSIPKKLFKDKDELKVVIHTWLAWQEDPGLPYGTAITARFLDPDVPQADVLVSWLNRLFFQTEGAS